MAVVGEEGPASDERASARLALADPERGGEASKKGPAGRLPVEAAPIPEGECTLQVCIKKGTISEPWLSTSADSAM